VVKAGDIVKAKVMEVDVPRKRIALSLRLDDTPGEKVEGNNNGGARGKSQNRNQTPRNTNNATKGNPPQPAMGSMGALLQQAMKKK
jgi:uncharacterized protein